MIIKINQKKISLSKASQLRARKKSGDIDSNAEKRANKDQKK